MIISQSSKILGQGISGSQFYVTIDDLIYFLIIYREYIKINKDISRSAPRPGGRRVVHARAVMSARGGG